MRRRLRSTLLAEIAAKTSRPATPDVASDNRDRTSSLDSGFGGTKAFTKTMRDDVGHLTATRSATAGSLAVEYDDCVSELTIPCLSGSDDPLARPEPHLERENFWRRARTIRIAARNPKAQRHLGFAGRIAGGSGAAIRFGANFRRWRHGGDAARVAKAPHVYSFDKPLILLVPQEGFEPPTPSLRMMCSTN